MKFFKPETADQAINLKKREPDSYFLAGGTELNSLFSAEKKIGSLISLEKLNLNRIERNYVGSCATLEEIKTHTGIHPALAEAASHLASRNVRNMATIGGNIASRQSSSDMLPVLISLKAKITLALKSGEKEVDIRSWIENPEKNRGLILGFKLPGKKIKVFQKKYSRTKNDLPLLKISAGYSFKGGSLSSVSVAAGCMAPTVIYLEKTSSLLEETKIENLHTEKIFSQARQEVNPIDDQRATASYRIELLRDFLREFTENLKKRP